MRGHLNKNTDMVIRRMETCIKLFHHSLFGGVSSSMDDPGEEENAGRRRNHGEEKGENGRRINVELTYG